MRERKNQKDMTAADWSTFIDAVNHDSGKA